MKSALLLLLLPVLALSACGSETPAADPATPPPAARAAGPALSVQEALVSKLDVPLLVRGYIVAGEGTIRLCDALAESFPPQCGVASLLVEGVVLDDLPGLTTAGGVTWSEREVKLLGRVEDGMLVVESTASA
jgi:hypothetical protein